MRNLDEIKFQACNLCYAMLRNINDNFESVSFTICDDGDIQVKIILTKKSVVEEGYIDDLIAEFTAKQEGDKVRVPDIVVGKNHQPLDNLVFRKSI